MTLDSNSKRERARQLATDYSASQREKDQQDRNRGSQKRGYVSEGAETMSAGSMDRETKRVDRVPLSETTQVESELHSANKFSNTPQATKTKSENLKNSNDPWR